MWHILNRRLLLLLLMLAIGSSSSSISDIREPTIGVAAIVTGESTTGYKTTLPCTMGVIAVGIEKKGFATIGVGTHTRFSSSHISQCIVLPMITSTSRKTVCLISTNLVYLLGQ
jgi:hypothetical protein